jgi:2-polyprenyl-6-methoxyphenol hydroxylase-like FAD-dependent oxidoreductase
MRKKITIIGGGIAGLTVALAFQKAGYVPIIFEAADNITPIGAGLGLAANAIKALDRLGIKESVLNKGRLLTSFTIKDEKGKIITHTETNVINEKYGLDNFTIHRADLHNALLTEIHDSQLILSKRCMDIKQTSLGITLIFKDGSTYNTDYLIVADGINSKVRQKLLPDTLPRYAGYTCWRAVVDNKSLGINNSYEVWGKAGRFGVVPLANDQLYWFATINSSANNPLFKNYRIPDLLKWFDGYTDEIKNILNQTSDESLIWNDIKDLKPLEKYAFDNILLVGDAAHGTTPNMGQGACQAIEDAAVLYDELSKGKSLKEVFLSFEKRRIPKTHYIITQSARIGKIAQLSNPFLISARNIVFRNIPESIKLKQFEILYKTDF